MKTLTLSAALLAASTAACSRAETSASASSVVPSTTAAAESGKEITIPAGTHLPIVLDTNIGSDTSRVEEPVSAHLQMRLVIDGRTVLPVGTEVTGVVTDAKRSGKVKGRAHVAFRFEWLEATGGVSERYRIHTEAVARTAEATKGKDALEIGGGAAGGALVGALIGGGKGAAIGAAAGGGAGTAIVLSTSGKEIHLNRGAVLRLRLIEPVAVRVRG
jgi:hypothetical protein